MNRSCLIIGVWFTLVQGAMGAAVPVCEPLQISLERSLNSCLDQNIFADVSVGVKVQRLSTNPVDIWSNEATQPLIPASAIKVFTTAIALISMGKDAYQDTPILTDGEVIHGVVEGNVYLVGRGDPCLEGKHLRLAVQKLKKSGIYVINGDICYDTTFIEDEDPRFAEKARHYYAPPSALTIDRNSIRLRMDWSGKPRLVPRHPTSYARVVSTVRFSPAWLPGLPDMKFAKKPWGDKYVIKGKLTKGDISRGLARVLVTRPGLYGATILNDALKSSGVTVTGKVRRAVKPRKTKPLLQIHTAPLIKAIKTINCKSSNVLAELVARLLGAKLKSAPGNAEKGLSVLQQYCKSKLGIADESFKFVDACGLSYENKATAAHFSKGLAHFYKKLGATFLRTLPRLGHHRSVSRPAPPDFLKIYVKTGVLPVNGVNTAVGYLVNEEDGQVYTFALLANKRNPKGRTGDRELVTPLLEALVSAFTERNDNEVAAAD